jgi:hypothetical protein
MTKTIILVTAIVALVGACAQKAILADRLKLGISRYCMANEVEREALRSQLMGPGGPLIIVHCENLV